MQKTLNFQANFSRPAPFVYEHLSDPRNFIGLQPLLISISNIQETQPQGVKTLSYENVEEFIFLGFLKYHNRIQVQTRLTEPGKRMDAFVISPGGVKLHVEYLFTPNEQGSTLDEVFHIEAPGFLMNFVIQQASQAQTTVLTRLQQRMQL
jgi:hypothetical protein